MSKYIRKTSDEWRLLGDYGQGFEEVTAEETYEGIRARLREYRENEPGVPFSVRYARVKLTAEEYEAQCRNDA